jgi:hypothetical protein
MASYACNKYTPKEKAMLKLLEAVTPTTMQTILDVFSQAFSWTPSFFSSANTGSSLFIGASASPVADDEPPALVHEESFLLEAEALLKKRLKLNPEISSETKKHAVSTGLALREFASKRGETAMLQSDHSQAKLEYRNAIEKAIFALSMATAEDEAISSALASDTNQLVKVLSKEAIKILHLYDDDFLYCSLYLGMYHPSNFAERIKGVPFELLKAAAERYEEGLSALKRLSTIPLASTMQPAHRYSWIQNWIETPTSSVAYALKIIETEIKARTQNTIAEQETAASFGGVSLRV